MSTRCVINFTYGNETEAKIYRHSGGYPETDNGVLADLGKFFSAVEHDTKDTRFGDPSYLAAKFVVWQAEQNASHYDVKAKKFKRNKRLNFIGVGVVREDPGDVEFLYFVDCNKRDAAGRPTVSYKQPGDVARMTMASGTLAVAP